MVRKLGAVILPKLAIPIHNVFECTWRPGRKNQWTTNYIQRSETIGEKGTDEVHPEILQPQSPPHASKTIFLTTNPQTII